MKNDPKKLINIRFVLRTDQNADHHAGYAGPEGFDGSMLNIIHCTMTHEWDLDPGDRSIMLIILRGVIDLYHGYLAMEKEQKERENWNQFPWKTDF